MSIQIKLEDLEVTLKQYSPDVKLVHSLPLQKIINRLGLNLNEFNRVGLSPRKAISLCGPKTAFLHPISGNVIDMMNARLKEGSEQSFVCCPHVSVEWISIFAKQYENDAITYLNKIEKLKAFL